MIFSRLSFCAECGVAFARRKKSEPHREYCDVHREPRLSRDIEMKYFLAWAKDNFENLKYLMKIDNRISMAAKGTPYNYGGQRSYSSLGGIGATATNLFNNIP